MVSTCPSSMHSIVAVRRLSGVRKPSSPIRRPGRSSTPISFKFSGDGQEHFVGCVVLLEQNIALAIFALGHKRLEPFHRRIALRCGTRLLDQSEHLTEANGIDGEQQE